MKLRITPAIYDEVGPAIEDALRRGDNDRPDPTDSTYLKINTAWEQAASAKRGVVIEADVNDVAELLDRAKYQIECVVPDNLPCSDPYERGFWLGRQRAYKALIKQIAGG